MQRSSLTEGEVNYYLGDLVLHQRRYTEAKVSHARHEARPRLRARPLPTRAAGFHH